MTRKFLFALAFALAASPATAGEIVPDTIYNPNVSFPSEGDVQSLKFLDPDYGFREQLHLDQPWTRLFDGHVWPEENESAD